MGRGMGGGMGMGRGMGAGGAIPLTDPTLPIAGQAGQVGGVPLPPAMTGEPEIELLKAQAQAMEEQLKVVNAQISQAEQQATIPGLVAVVDEGKCTACGICREVCPARAIIVDQGARIDPAKCDGCGRCVADCPQDAISLHKAV